MSAEPVQLRNSTPFDIIVESVDDALLEARHWADGKAAETQEQVDEIARLIDDLNGNAKALEAERVAEKKPLDDAIEVIQTRYNVYLAPLKNKKPGRVPMAIDALNAAKRTYLLKVEAELEAKRQKAREEAEAAAKAAADAARAAQADDLEAREAAELLVQRAEAVQAEARLAEKARAHAHGGGRAQGLRTRTVAEITDLDAAVKFYWRTDKQAFVELVQKLADNDARSGRRAAEGIAFMDERY